MTSTQYRETSIILSHTGYYNNNPNTTLGKMLKPAQCVESCFTLCGTAAFLIWPIGILPGNIGPPILAQVGHLKRGEEEWEREGDYIVTNIFISGFEFPTKIVYQ
jgi:hypothetical protein